jgi:hypothetical protein
LLTNAGGWTEAVPLHEPIPGAHFWVLSIVRRRCDAPAAAGGAE